MLFYRSRLLERGVAFIKSCRINELSLMRQLFYGEECFCYFLLVYFSTIDAGLFCAAETHEYVAIVDIVKSEGEDNPDDSIGNTKNDRGFQTVNARGDHQCAKAIHSSFIFVVDAETKEKATKRADNGVETARQ